MTMNFAAVAEALGILLNSQAGGSFRTLDYQRQITNAEQVLDGNREIQVFYSSGEFDKKKGSRMGPVNHDMTFRVELYMSKASEGDLSALDSATSDGERAAAIATFELASRLANIEMDQFLSDVYEILMDTRNDNLELPFPWDDPAGTIILANTWVNSMRKDSPMGDAGLTGLTGVITFQCDVRESLRGDTGIAMTEGIDGSYSMNSDPELQETDEATPIVGQILAKTTP